MKKLLALLIFVCVTAHSTDNFNTLDTNGTAASTQSGTWTVQPGNTANTTPWLVTSGGNAASGATDSGNPVKIGGVFNTTPATLSSGQRGDIQLDAVQSLKTGLYLPGTTTASSVLNQALSDTISNTIGAYRFVTMGLSFDANTSWARVHSGFVSPSTALTGYQNTIPTAIYNATPTVRTEGQGGPLQADVDGKLQVVAKATPGTMTDRSGTITSGGTAQTIMAANANRKYLLIQNSSDTAMWCNFTTTAVASQPSFSLIAGASFVMENNAVSTEAVSCIGATTGKIFTAKEM